MVYMQTRGGPLAYHTPPAPRLPTLLFSGSPPADPPGLLHPALQVHVAPGLFALRLPGGAALVPTEAVRQVQGAVRRQAARGRQARGALGMAESVAFWEKDGTHGFYFLGLTYGPGGILFGTNS